MNNPDVLIKQLSEYDTSKDSINEALKKLDEFIRWAKRIREEQKKETK